MTITAPGPSAEQRLAELGRGRRLAEPGERAAPRAGSASRTRRPRQDPLDQRRLRASGRAASRRSRRPSPGRRRPAPRRPARAPSTHGVDRRARRPSIPTLTASTPMSAATARDLGDDHLRRRPRATISTPTVFCAVSAVIAVVPWTPQRANAFRSAWIPAPPPESEPAIARQARTRGSAHPSRLFGRARRPVRASSRRARRPRRSRAARAGERDRRLAGAERRRRPRPGRRSPHPPRRRSRTPRSDRVERRAGTRARRASRRRPPAGGDPDAEEQVEDVAGVADQVGAVADQLVGALGDPDADLARAPRRPCGRARAPCRR